MRALEYFDRTYIVNLPEREDRRREMSRELAAANLDPSPGRVEFFPAIRPDDPAEFPSRAARGCFLSHLSILQIARDEKLARVLILEDDLSFSRLFCNEQEQLLDELVRHPWDIAYLGHQLDLPKTRTAGFVPYDRSIMLTHFYAVNASVIDRLIGFFETMLTRPSGHPEGGPMHLDGAYTTFRRQNPDVATYVSSPNLGWQRSSRSDIADVRWFDRMPGVRWVVDSARTVKNRLRMVRIG